MLHLSLFSVDLILPKLCLVVCNLPFNWCLWSYSLSPRYWLSWAKSPTASSAFITVEVIDAWTRRSDAVICRAAVGASAEFLCIAMLISNFWIMPKIRNGIEIWNLHKALDGNRTSKLHDSNNWCWPWVSRKNFEDMLAFYRCFLAKIWEKWRLL